MDLKDVQFALSKIENNSFDISNSLISVIRIAQYRLDIEEILFCRLIKVSMSKENSNHIFESVKRIALKKGISGEQYKNIYQKVVRVIVDLRTCDWYDVQTKKILNDQVITFSLNEIIINLNQLQDLLENNKVPEGLAPLDTYFANESKKTMDNILYNHILNYQTVLSRIKDYLFDYLVKVEDEMLSVREREVMDKRKELELLIEEGFEVKDRCFVSHPEWLNYIQGADYVSWIERSKMFIKDNINDIEIYNAFVNVADQANGSGEGNFEVMIGRLRALLTYDFEKNKEIIENHKITKIFISHSSKDVGYVSLLVQLINDIGIKKSEDYIFCSSLSGYGIPYGENIYDYLKNELENNIMVLFVLSHNYYESAPCLNEMGAAWISSKVYNSVLTPNFDFRKISGAIDPSKISFYMHDEDGLNKFKDKIVESFELEDVNYQIWEKDRKRFVEKVEELAKLESETLGTQIKIEKVRKVDGNKLDIQLRFINVTDQEIEFKFIDIELADSQGNKITVSVEEEHLSEFRLYSRENKIVNWVFYSDEQNDYNPRRDVKSQSIIKFEIY